MPLTADAQEYLDFSPLSADLDRIPDEELLARVKRARSLPENVRRVLLSVETSEYMKNFGTRQRLTREQVQELAEVLGKVFLGEESAGMIAQRARERLGVPAARAAGLAQELTQKFITPNYFQIAQVYERKHGKEEGKRPTSNGFAAGDADGGLNGETTTTAVTAPRESRESPPSETPPPTTTPRAAPPRIVDLRNGAIPSRLPPPPALPAPPPPPRPPPPKPAPLPPNAGPSADDLLDNLGKRPTPPPPAPRSPEGGVGFVPPPGGGTHGPLPKPPP